MILPHVSSRPKRVAFLESDARQVQEFVNNGGDSLQEDYKDEERSRHLFNKSLSTSFLSIIEDARLKLESSRSLLRNEQNTNANTEKQPLYIVTSLWPGSNECKDYTKYVNDQLCRQEFHCIGDLSGTSTQDIDLVDSSFLVSLSLIRLRGCAKRTIKALQILYEERIKKEKLRPVLLLDRIFCFPFIRAPFFNNKSLKNPDLSRLVDLINQNTSFHAKFIVLVDQDIRGVATSFLYSSRKLAKRMPKGSISTKNVDMALLRLFDASMKSLLAQLMLIDEEDIIYVHLKTTSEPLVAQNQALTFLIENLEFTWLTMLKILAPNDFKHDNRLSSFPVVTKMGSLKKDKRSSSRFVFFAGIEGTGHHLWQSVVMSMLTQNITASTSVAADCELNRLLYVPKVSCWNAYRTPQLYPPGLFCHHSSDQFIEYLEKLNNKLKHFRPSREIRTYFLNLVRLDFPTDGLDYGCGSIASYPGFSGIDKGLNKPDLLVLSRLFQQVNFSPVILLRNVENVLLSDIWHRKFNGVNPALYEMRILILNLSSLLIETITSLIFMSSTRNESRLIKVVCVEYESSSAELAEDLKGILGHDLRQHLRKVRMRKTRPPSLVKKNLEQLEQYRDIVVLLSRLDSLLRAFC